jgi:hypothetical protein
MVNGAAFSPDENAGYNDLAMAQGGRSRGDAPHLKPSDIWVELGQIIYYFHVGEYTALGNYYFEAFRGGRPEATD